MNICFRFCLGNTDLSLAKGLYQIMEDHTVVAWTDLHIVGLYGRPEDLVEATIKSFYIRPEASPTPSSSFPFSSSSSPPLPPFLQTATTTATLAPLPSARSPSIETMSLEELQAKVKEAQSPPGDGRDVKGKGNGKDTLSCSTSSSTTLSQDIASTSSSQAAKEDDDDDEGAAEMGVESLVLPPHKWKTDYDLWAQKHPPSDMKKNIRRKNEQPPFQILIALPENIRLYLLTVSGAFTSYLLEEKTVGACYAQGGVMEDLLEARDEAEMKVSDSREHNMTVVETRDLEALRRVLWGVTTALATEPMKEHTESWMKELYAKELEEWDQTLKLYRETHEDPSLGWVTGDQEQEDEGETWIEDDQDKKKPEGGNEGMLQDPWTWTDYEGLDRYAGKAKKKRR